MTNQLASLARRDYFYLDAFRRVNLGMCIIKKIYSPCLVSIVHLAYFIASFQNKTDEVMSGQSCFERPEPRGRFLAEIRIGCSIFAPNTKKEKSFVLFSGQLVKISLFSTPIRTIFALLFQFSSAPCYR